MSITLTTSVLSGVTPRSSLSNHIPVITRTAVGKVRMVSTRKIRKDRRGDTCMILAKPPKYLCFCHREPSWTIQKIMNRIITAMNGIRKISSHISDDSRVLNIRSFCLRYKGCGPRQPTIVSSNIISTLSVNFSLQIWGSFLFFKLEIN